MYTYYSSFAFLAVSLMTAGSWMQPYLSVLSATSILHHAKFYQNYPGRSIVQTLDRGMAHLVGFRALYDASHIAITEANRWYIYMCYCCFLYVAVIYHGRLRHVDDWPLHKSIHVVASFGLWLLYKCQHPNKLEWLCQSYCENLAKIDDDRLQCPLLK